MSVGCVGSASAYDIDTKTSTPARDQEVEGEGEGSQGGSVMVAGARAIPGTATVIGKRQPRRTLDQASQVGKGARRHTRPGTPPAASHPPQPPLPVVMETVKVAAMVV